MRIPAVFLKPAIRKLMMIVGLPLVISILINLPAFQASFMPTRDAFGIFSVFVIFAQHLRQFGEMPLWLPCSTFGTAMDYQQLAYLSPANWLFIWIAVVFRDADLLCLFKLSLILEQVIFGASCAWFANLLFRRVSVQVFFVIASMMTSSLWKQPFFNLRMVATLPWIIGLMLLAFRRKSRVLLFASALPIPVCAYGLPYYHPIYLSFLWLAALSINLANHRRDGLSWLIAWPKRSQIMGEALILVSIFFFTGAIGGQLSLAENGQTPISPGRDLTTGTTTLSTFLTWGGVTDLPTLFWSTSVGWPDIAHNQEAFIYCGVPVLFAAVIGIFFARSRSARLARSLLLFTAAFSIAGFLALSLYYMPLVDNFRHVAYTSVVVRFILCIVAGFGMQSLIDGVLRRHLVSSQFMTRIPLFTALFCIVFLSVPAIWINAPSTEQPEPQVRLIIFSLVLGLVSGLAIWVATRLLDSKRASFGTGIIMLVALVVTAGALTVKIYQRVTWNLSGELTDYMQNAINAPLRYVPVRGFIDPQIKEFVNDLVDQGRFTYSPMSSMLSYDAQAYEGRTDVIPERTLQLLKLSQSYPEGFHNFTMDGVPKAYLAVDPVMVLTPQIRVNPGDVYVESDHGGLILKREESPAIKEENYSFNHVTFEVPADGNAAKRRFLVYQDAWHPEWTAMKGGESVKVLPADIAFKAVEIPADASQITFHFGSLERSLLASLNACNALLVLALELTALFFLACATRSTGLKSIQGPSRVIGRRTKTGTLPSRRR